MSKKKHQPLSGEPQNNPDNHDAELKSEIERQIGQIVQGGNRSQVVERVTALVRRETFQGPLPHPRHLQGYEEICPGAADRIISMAENAQNSQIAADTRDQEAEISDRRLGMLLGFFCFVLMVVAALICAWLDYPYLGGSFIAVSTIGVVSRFIIGRKNGNGGT